MTPQTLLVWILTCLIWSTVWLFIKLGVRDVPPSTFAVFRLAIALAVLVPVVIAQRTPLPRAKRDYVLIATTGVLLLGLNYALLNWGIQFISSGLTAVLQAMTPAFGMVFAHLLLHDEKITRLKVGALALGLGGVAIVFSDRFDIAGVAALRGSIAVVASSVCVAAAYVMMRRSGNHLDPSIITSGQMISAIVPLSVYVAAVEGNPLDVRWSSMALVAVVYLALLGSVAGTWLNYWLLKRIGATRVLLMGLIEPILALALGAAFLDETLNSRAAIGSVVILIAVALVMDLFTLRKAPR